MQDELLKRKGKETRGDKNPPPLYKVNRANPKRDNMVKICPINPSFSRVAGCNIHDLHLRNAVWYMVLRSSTPQNLIMVSGFGTQ